MTNEPMDNTVPFPANGNAKKEDDAGVTRVQSVQEHRERKESNLRKLQDEWIDDRAEKMAQAVVMLEDYYNRMEGRLYEKLKEKGVKGRDLNATMKRVRKAHRDLERDIPYDCACDRATDYLATHIAGFTITGVIDAINGDD